MLPDNLKYRCGKLLHPCFTTGCLDVRPVDLFCMSLGKYSDVRDLPDPDAAVQKMLISMAEQVQQMICRVKRPDADILDLLPDSPIPDSVKQLIHISVSCGFVVEELEMHFNIGGGFRPVKTDLVSGLRVEIRVISVQAFG